MQTKNLIKIIKAEASVLTALIDELPNDGDVQAFEVELLLNKIQALTNLANQLNQQVLGVDVNQPVDKKIEIPPVKAEPVEAQIQEPKKEEPELTNSPVAKKDEPERIEIKKDVKKDLPANDFIHNLEETQSIAIEKTVEATQPQKTEQPTRKDEPVAKTHKHPSHTKQTDAPQTTLAEKYQQESPSVNDMMAGIKKKHDLASTFHHQPIPDLKKSIKINDRIRFINELFEKDNHLFEETVAKINQSKNLDEALAVIFPQFNWDQENQTTIHFLELVFRRFQNI
jgi:hypothetical protein